MKRLIYLSYIIIFVVAFSSIISYADISNEQYSNIYISDKYKTLNIGESDIIYFDVFTSGIDEDVILKNSNDNAIKVELIDLKKLKVVDLSLYEKAQNIGDKQNRYWILVTAVSIEDSVKCDILSNNAEDSFYISVTEVSNANLLKPKNNNELKLDMSGTKKLGMNKTLGFLVYTDNKSGELPKVTASDASVARIVYDRKKDAGYKKGYYIEVTGLKEGASDIIVEYHGQKVSFTVNVVKLIGWHTVDGKKYYGDANGNTVKGYQNIDGFKYYFDSQGVLSSKVGIDVSAYQSSINWNAVKNSGVEFVIIRVGYTGWGTGSINLDSRFNSHIEGALAAGLDVGVYYYSQAITTAEAKKEADFVAEKIAPYRNRISYPVVFDTESTGEGGRGDKLTKAARTQIANSFCMRIIENGYTPMIYANLSWLNNNLDMNLLSPYMVWVAQYYSVNQYAKPYKCWQYTSSGRVNGINGNVDMNIWLN